MRIILTGDNGGFLKATLEQDGHKVFAVGPNSSNFPVRMEMLHAAHAVKIMAHSLYVLAGLPDALIHAAVMDGPFGHVMHANLTARFILNEAFLVSHLQPAGVEAKDGEAAEDTPEQELRIVQLIGFPRLDQTTQVRCAKVAQLALAMDLAERIESLGLPLSSAVVSPVEEEGVEITDAAVASAIKAALEAPAKAYSFHEVR